MTAAYRTPGRHDRGPCFWRRPVTLAVRVHAPVAQLDRASVSEAEGHRFDSCRAHHLAPRGGWPDTRQAPRDSPSARRDGARLPVRRTLHSARWLARHSSGAARLTSRSDALLHSARWLARHSSGAARLAFSSSRRGTTPCQTHSFTPRGGWPDTRQAPRDSSSARRDGARLPVRRTPSLREVAGPTLVRRRATHL